MSQTITEPRPYTPAAPADDEIDLADLFGGLIENRWLIAAVTLVILALGTTYAFLATPIYKADALIQVEEKKSGLGDLDINALFEGDTSVTAEIEIIKSRRVLGAVVNNLKLDIVAEPSHFPVFGAALARRGDPDNRRSIRVDSLEVPGTLLGETLELVVGPGGRFELLGPGGERLAGGVVGEPAVGSFVGESLSLFVSELRGEEGDAFTVVRQSRLQAIDDLQRALSVSEKGKGSGILSLSLQGEDREVIAQNLNEVADVYVRQNVEQKSKEAEQTLKFLNEKLPDVKREMEAAEVALNSYRLEKGSVDLPLETQAILETIVTVEGQLNELRRERESVIQSFTPAHPMVVALDRQIASLDAEIDGLNVQVRDLPNTQQEVLRLVRDVEVNTQLYTALLNTAQELRVVKAGTVGNVRVVDDAVAPYKPVKPKKAMIVLLSLVLGVFAGVVSAFVRRAMSGGIEDPNLIEQHVNIPVYATIVHSRNQDKIYRRLKSQEDKRAILAINHPDDMAVESLRNLRTALHFGMMDAKNNCIMVAGPCPDVGKSFVSVNLAAVLTANEKKVLLIDGDMRRGHLHEYLGLERDSGLSEFISGDIPIGKALHATTVPGLTFIPTGKIPPNPAELLLHQRFTNCLNVLSPRFDHIIIDSPPILAVTDAAIVGQMAGATLLVLKSGAHPMREIEASVSRLKQANVNLRGLLFNDASIASKRYGAGKYSYQYTYTN